MYMEKLQVVNLKGVTIEKGWWRRRELNLIQDKNGGCTVPVNQPAIYGQNQHKILLHQNLDYSHNSDDTTEPVHKETTVPQNLSTKLAQLSWDLIEVIEAWEFLTDDDKLFVLKIVRNLK